MPPKRKRPDPKRAAEIIANARRAQAVRADGYRERALAIFTHVCGRCGRAFAGKDLRELTVHHKDNNHDNNPPDGSNWELLCRYCHDDEHQKSMHSGYHTAGTRERYVEEELENRPFAGLGDLLKPDQENEKPR